MGSTSGADTQTGWIDDLECVGPSIVQDYKYRLFRDKSKIPDNESPGQAATRTPVQWDKQCNPIAGGVCLLQWDPPGGLPAPHHVSCRDGDCWPGSESEDNARSVNGTAPEALPNPTCALAHACSPAGGSLAREPGARATAAGWDCKRSSGYSVGLGGASGSCRRTAAAAARDGRRSTNGGSGSRRASRCSR